MNWGRWAVILIVIMIVCAVAGFLVDTVRWLAGAAFVVCLVVLLAKMVTGKRGP